MKKLIALLLVTVMMVGLLAGCGKSGNSETAPSGDTTAKVEKIRIYVPTSGKYDDIDAVMEKVNEITREKIAVEVEFVPFQFGQWFGQYSLFLSGTEDVDILVNYGGFLNAYSQGACYDLTDLLQQYGKDIVAMEGDYLKGGMIDGRQYALPIYAVYAWNMGIIYRQDVVEELGLQDKVAAVKTLEDWEPILAAVKEAPRLISSMAPGTTWATSTAS